MNKNFIAVIDSGIGGLSTLKLLLDNVKGYNFIYFGDNSNAPYGLKTNAKLLSLFSFNYSLLAEYPICAIVIACNTLSAVVDNTIIKDFPVPIFKIYPPVESLLKKGKTLLIATPLTSSKYSQSEAITVFPCPNLALDIESNPFNLNSLDLYKHFGSLKYTKGYFDNVILGCTHYELIKNQIFDHFCPKNILSGSAFTLQNLSAYLKTLKSLDFINRNEVLFIGKNAKFNKSVFEKVVNR